MRALAALSRFVGNTFAYWVLIFAVVAYTGKKDKVQQ